MPDTPAKRCARCVLDANYRNISFDREGVCNYCRTYEQLQTKLTDFDRLGALRRQRFDAVRGHHDYDCLLGMSGGKDSSWIALDLVRNQNLKILGFTFDNGFLTDYAKNNIKTVVETLRIDHFFHEVDWDLHRTFYEQAVRCFGKPCPGCSYSSYALSFKLAFEKHIPIVIHGRSRSQMFRELLAGSPDAFLPFLKLNLNPYDPARNREATAAARERLQFFIGMAIRDPDSRAAFYREFFPRDDDLQKADMLPEFLGYFLYQPYDEQQMMDDLVNELGWQRPDERGILTHADCGVHAAAGYLHERVFGYPILSFELSVLVREGTMTREQALQRLDRERAAPPPNEALDYMCDRVGLPQADLEGILVRLNRRNRWRNRWLRLRNAILRPTLDI